MNAADGSALLRNAFAALACIVGFGAVGLVHFAGRGRGEPRAATRARTAAAAAVVGAWMVLTLWVASTGVIADMERRPPPLMLLMASVLVVSITIAFTRIGTRLTEGLPLWLLVGFQSFRLPLELLMHRAAEEGLMPRQMSYDGWNFDIVTGASALVVAWLLARGFPQARTVALAWNVLGAALLVNILVVAMISTPFVAAFGPERLNTWVAHPPYVWLPSVMVVCAITGHLLILRKLRATATRRL